MLRKFGDSLMWLGTGMGTAVGVGLMFGVALPGLPWLVAVGLVKLTLIAALGLIAGGAIVRRLSIRAEQRDLLLPHNSSARQDEG